MSGVSPSRVAVSLVAGVAGVAGVAAALAATRAVRRRLRRPLAAPRAGQRIVILGAGFGGVTAARALGELLPHSEDCEIVLVDQHNYLLFTPMLTEVVAGEVGQRAAISAIRRLSPRVTFVQGHVESVDPRTRQVIVAAGDPTQHVPPARLTLVADQLVIALGSETGFHHIAGLRSHALTVKMVADAQAIHDRAIALLERADVEPDADERRKLLTFVVGGGGFSGVETMAALNGLVRGTAQLYPRVHQTDIRMVLVHPDDRLLPELGEDLAGYVLDELRRRDVEVKLNTIITGAGPDHVDLKGHSPIAAHTLIWTAGVSPSQLVRTLDCQHGRHGGISVDACLRVPDREGVWAIGDCAEVPHLDGLGTYAPTAQNATREGTHLARNIAAMLQGHAPTPFVHHPIGELAIVGRRAGVASVYGIHVAGFPAWVMWRAIYLAMEPRLRQRIRTGFDWLLDILFGGEATEISMRGAAVEERTDMAVGPSGNERSFQSSDVVDASRATDGAPTEHAPASTGD